MIRTIHDHPNINRFLGVTKNDIGYVMVLDYANEGDLRHYLGNKVKFDSLQWEDKIQMALDITRGLKYLHSKEIIHRDLHSKNILVNNGKLLLADFGLSKQLTEITSNSTANKRGIFEYIDPQCYKNTSYKKDKKSDVYSLGILLWEITSGRPPFRDLDRNNLYYLIGNACNREDPIEGTPLKYQQLYQECWDDDPKKRPNINKVYETLSQLNTNYTNDQHEDYLETSHRDELEKLNAQSNQSDLYIETVLIDDD
ncbi:kinase-like domain-containing protein [Glomus cerebriforme]|uniref:Kinase-like domain-containing protein n=1 Tax=Glomus cerebriforme TaxID=658196 RepID=A0A397SAH3_9GLOM|nr:kinase-like domain-containing protein [Glomus cerebriforme]